MTDSAHPKAETENSKTNASASFEDKLHTAIEAATSMDNTNEYQVTKNLIKK